MKKLISILVVFAVLASAVIAQEGSWSVSGSGEIGAIFNFVPDEPTVGASGYNMYGYYGGSGATLGLTYSRGDLSAGLSFDTTDGIYGDVSFNNGDMAFQYNQDFTKLFPTSVWDPNANSGAGGTVTTGPIFDPGRLWGYYKFLDGALHIEAAINSRDTNYWNVGATDIVGNVFDSAGLASDTGDIINAVVMGFIKHSMGWGFMSVDHNNYLLADFNLSSVLDGLSVGIMFPDLFDFGGASVSGWGSWYGTGRHPVGGSETELADGVLSKTRFGAKYASGPVEAAIQFALRGPNGTDPDKTNSGLNFGFNFAINDQMKVGVGLEGLFDGDDSDFNKFAFGLSFSYADGPLNAKLEGGLLFRGMNAPQPGSPTDPDKGVLGIRPHVSYNIVENYLCLSLDVQLQFYLDSDYADNMGMYYEITPELWFNVMGTGAGEGYYYPNNTAIILRYKVAGFSDKDFLSPTNGIITNAVDITFKWSF